MSNQFIAIAYLIVILVLSIFMIYRLKITKTKGAAGAGWIYAGLLLIFLSALINLLQQQSGYPDWFLNGIYTAIAIVKFICLVGGVISFVAGLSIYFSYWGDRDLEVVNQLGKLKILESLQQESRYPFPMSELLDHTLKHFLTALEEEAGAIFLLNRNQRQFVLTTSVGLSKEEISLLEYYPYGPNIVSQSIEEEKALLSSDFRSLGGKAQLAVSRFRSILVIPLISGKSKLGALLFFSQEERRYTRDYIAIIMPVADWFSEKIEVNRLERELSRNLKELDSHSTRLSDFFRKLDRVIKSGADLSSVSSFAEKCLGLAGCDEVWLLGLVNGHLHIYGGTAEQPDFSDNFRAALLSAIPRNKAVILNQEANDDAGNPFIARSSVLLPADNRGNAVLLRNNNGPTILTEEDLKGLEMIAAMAGLVISNSEARVVNISRSRGLESVARILKIKISAPEIDKDLRAILAELAGILPPGSILLLYERREEHYIIIDSNYVHESTGEISIAVGEGTTGQSVITRVNAVTYGAVGVTENLHRFDDENRNCLIGLFNDRGKPVFQADYPIIVNDRVEFIISIFGFKDSPVDNTECHRLISVLVGLVNLKIEIDRTGSALREPLPETAMGVGASHQINELNNDLASISGYCQLAGRDLNLSGEVVNALDSILKTTENMARKIKSFFPSRMAAIGAEAQAVDLSHLINESLHRNNVSDNLYMIGGRPFEVNLELQKTPPLYLDMAELRLFFEAACGSFTENVSEEEIITISAYSQKEFIFIDLSRHRKNFPSVEPVAGFGRYTLPSAIDGHLRNKEFLERLAKFSGEFAYDKYSRIPSYYSFRLPIWGKEKSPSTMAAVEPLTILAVDDQIVILELLAAMCQSMGYKILTARDGREGLAVFEAHRPDLVIADLVMPGISGLELASKIKSLSASTTVIMITGWGVQIDNEKMTRAGVDYILHKPFRLEQLADLIARVKLSGIKN
jgi:CheY-like chemotaxis protein